MSKRVPEAARIVSGDRTQGVAVDVAALAEDGVDLDAERRRQILVAEASLERWTHWDALGIPWNAPVAAAKAAYIERVKVFHPDRYAGKRLGTFRGRLERVFKRMTQARDELADEARRAAYARRTAPTTEFTRMEARRLEDERRAEERKARVARQNPLFARVARVHEFVERGKRALAEGRFAAAANDLGLATGLDPKNAELAALAADARKKAASAKANDLFQKGLEAQLVGNVAAALERFREALGIVLEAEGNKKEARRELERALELDPALDGAKERLRKLRLFGGLLG